MVLSKKESYDLVKRHFKPFFVEMQDIENGVCCPAKYILLHF